MRPTDVDLVCAARNGDEQAFAALVERHWRRLVAFARSVVGDAEAEDIVQESLLVVWSKLSDLRHPEAFGAWTMKTLSRLCFRRNRGRTDTVQLQLVEEPEDRSSISTRATLDVEKMLGMLAPRQRAVMHLTVVEGMSDREIGELLDIEKSSVRAHRRRARDRLRHLLAPDGGDGNE